MCITKEQEIHPITLEAFERMAKQRGASKEQVREMALELIKRWRQLDADIQELVDQGNNLRLVSLIRSSDQSLVICCQSFLRWSNNIGVARVRELLG